MNKIRMGIAYSFLSNNIVQSCKIVVLSEHPLTFMVGPIGKHGGSGMHPYRRQWVGTPNCVRANFPGLETHRCFTPPRCKWKLAIVVGSKYHVGRTFSKFGRLFRDLDIPIGILSNHIQNGIP